MLKNADSTDMTELVRRHAGAWRGRSVFSPPPTSVDIKQAGLEIQKTDAFSLRYKSILQPTVTAAAVERVKRMAALPEFYRLNHIHQLSNTHIAVNLEGSHNRLSHSLGTLDVAGCFLDSIQSKLTAEGKAPLPQVQVKAVLVYAFVHDCFHGPMGHTLDLIRDVLWGARAGDRIDKHLLKTHVTKSSGFLWDAVKSHVARDENECKDIFLLLRRFLSSTAGLLEFAYLAEIVDSELDSDRIDYIWRDHVHLEMKSFEWSPEEIRQLIASVCQIEETGPVSQHRGSIGDTVEDNPKKEVHLYFGSQYRERVRGLLEKRVDFYRRFYEHPVKLIADEMLVHAVFYSLKRAQALRGEGAPGWADEFAFLTDDGFIALFNELTLRPGMEIPRFLLQDCRANRNFVVVYRKALPRTEFRDLVKRDELIKIKLLEFEKIHWEQIQAVASAPPDSLVNDRDYEVLIRKLEGIVTQRVIIDKDGNWVEGQPAFEHRELKYTTNHDVLRLQNLYGGGFLKRAKLEDLLWSQLCKRTDFDKRLVDLANVIAEFTGGSTAEIHLQLKETPLVFISPSWIPHLSEAELAAHARGVRRGRVRFHTEGRPSSTQVELRAGSEEEDYPLVLSAPASLADEETRAVISSDFGRILEERRWLLPDVL